MMFSMRSWSLLCASVVVCAAGALWAPAAHAQAVRVCVDPDNLPFSKEIGPVKGIYVELAELVGQKVNEPIQWVWWLTYNQRKAMRNTVKQGKCDAIFAVPTTKAWHARGLDRSVSFLNLSYALIAPPELTFTKLEDLRDKTVGVQFQTNPHVLMSMQSDYKIKTYRTAEQLLEGLAKKEIDAGMLWGPVAGYLNKANYESRWQVTPMAGSELEGAVSVAIRTEVTGLKARIDKALIELKPEIAELAKKYGLPSNDAVDMSVMSLTSAPDKPAPTPDKSSAAVPVPGAGVHQVADAKSAKAEPVELANADMSPEAMAKTGAVKFNDVCAHCHGTNGVQFVKPRDLRRLRLRYDTDWEQTARETMTNGIDDLGMPSWKDIFSDQQFEEVLAFLRTIQK